MDPIQKAKNAALKDYEDYAKDRSPWQVEATTTSKLSSCGDVLKLMADVAPSLLTNYQSDTMTWATRWKMAHHCSIQTLKSSLASEPQMRIPRPSLPAADTEAALYDRIKEAAERANKAVQALLPNLPSKADGGSTNEFPIGELPTDEWTEYQASAAALDAVLSRCARTWFLGSALAR
jgi:hypothetical protein